MVLKIRDERLADKEYKKTKKTKKQQNIEDETPSEDKRSYSADRCDDKPFTVEEGITYYEGTIDTTSARKDAKAILAKKGIIL